MANTIIFNSTFISYVAFSSIMYSLLSISKCDPSTKGFTIDLIHRDSPRSPSYDPSLSPYQRLTDAVQRSFNRVHNRFNTTKLISKKTPQPNIINDYGNYLMQYSIGTPPLPSLGIFDTGSDVTWTQCNPCHKCFTQNLPIFTPKKSSTYKTIPCNNHHCTFLQETSCSKSRKKECLYSEFYADGSFTVGQLAADTLTLAYGGGEKVISIPNIKFGCGFSNGVLFTAGESGVVGLGGGPASLVRQLGRLAHGKFSYCLVSISDGNANSSKLNFGCNARVSGRGVVSLPMAKKEPQTFYYLTMKGISVGNRRLRFYDGNPKTCVEGNIIIDSGTTVTLLPFGLYDKMVEVFKRKIKLKQIDDPQGMLDLCYYSKNEDITVPDVIVHFKGGNVNLKQENVFVPTSDYSLCFSALPIDGGDAIFGNLWQTNFLVGYDLVKRTVSFKAADCGK